MPRNGPTAEAPAVPLDSQAHSFILKIWFEGGDPAGDPVVWRGHITHVPGGERQYVKELDDITSFIAAYLDAMGARLNLRWRVKQWLRARKLGKPKAGR